MYHFLVDNSVPRPCKLAVVRQGCPCVLLPLSCATCVGPSADITIERGIDKVFACNITAFLSDKRHQGHQGILAVQRMRSLTTLPTHIPESAAIPIAHHTAVAAIVRTVAALLGLPVVQTSDLVVLFQFSDEVFEEAGLSGRRVGPYGTGVRVVSSKTVGCRMLVARFYNLDLLVGEFGLQLL